MRIPLCRASPIEDLDKAVDDWIRVAGVPCNRQLIQYPRYSLDRPRREHWRLETVSDGWQAEVLPQLP
jgi:hypothetical protein